MEHNNKNLVLAELLDNITLNLTNIDFSSTEEVLQASIKVLNIIDQASQNMNIPSLRALSHWMLLNTEKSDSNTDLIKELCSSGSYFNWIEILSSLLQTEERSLLEELQNKLNHPNWFIKPSNILIKDLIEWVESTTNIQSKVELEKPAITDKDNSLANNNDKSHSHAYKESELEDPSYYKEITPTKTASEHPKQCMPKLENTANIENKAFQNEDCLGKLGLELDEIVMSLFNLSNTSEDVLQDYETFNNKLEQLIVFTNSCSYSSIAQICRWCQRNIDLFARNKSAHLYHFLESGESWAWLELVSYCINEPDEPSNLSLLNTELNREEWMESVAIEDLQSLFLFLKNPKDQATSEEKNNDSEDRVEENHSKNESASLLDSKDIDLPNDNQEVNTLAELEQETGLSFTWDEDIHPELLSAYFEETPDLVTKIAELLQNISKTKASKEEHQNASRIAHTIKGSSAILGITALSELSHKLEDILDYSVNNNLSKEVLTLLSESSEHLIELFDSIKNQQNPPKNYPQILAKLTRFAESLASENPEDDSLLTLSMPTLPDFINATEVDSHENDLTKEIENKDNKNKNEETQLEEATAEKLAIINEPVLALDSEDDNSDFTTEMDDIVMSLSMIEINPDNPFFELNKTNLVKINEELQRLDLLSEISGYPEISKITQWYQNNLQQLFNQQNNSSKDFLISGECWTWIELTSACLANPEETSYLAELSQALMNPEWLDPIKTEDLQAILLLLSSSRQANHANLDDIEETDKTDSFSKTTDNLANDLANNVDNKIIKTSQENLEQLDPATVNTSTDPQYSFSWDDDIHPELLSVYLQETPDQIAEAAQLIYKITENKASKEDHQHAARMVHTIKGASGVVGITALAEFTHKLEDILEYSVEHQIPAELSSLLNESADCLEDLFETIINKKTPPLEFSPLLNKLTQQATALQNGHDNDSLDTLNAIDECEELKMPELPDFIKAQGSNKLETSPSNPIEAKTSEINKTTDEKIQSTAPAVVTETHIRVPIKVIDQLLNLAGELVTTTSQISDKIENSLLTNKQTKVQDHRIYKIIDELGATISKQEKNQSRQLNTPPNSNFDSLEMDTYNELHSITGLLAESILDGEEIDRQLDQQLTELSDYTRSLGRLNKELSDLILHSRMVSINTLIPKLERIIRQTCRKTGKKAELAITGNDINIDTDILNKLSDPLLHLLRNSIDHGIETPQERKAKNKYETGRIHLTFSREDKYICMELKDDGAGIDTNKVYQRALKLGMINPEAEYTKKEILQLILQAGFTTQNKVTDISGRGVGMDVVNNAVKSLRGTLEISSEKDQGTCFTIKAPLTLVTSATLIVEVSKHQVAIPADSIEQLFYLASSMVIEKDGAQYIQHNNQELPIISLASLLGWPVKQPDFSITNTLLMIKGKKEIHAVYIDKIVQSREIVIKSLAPWINTDKGLIGACHLPDGGVAPVINLPQLLSNGEKSTETIEKFQLTTTEPDNSIDKTPLVLIVDDSLSNQKALSLIIDQTEYDVVTAVNGLDALKIMNENEIDIVFTDLEMPRMNGLELTQAIRAWDIKKHIPIVMITSRTTNKHKQLAQKAGVNQYLTKPVITETLLESLEHWLTYCRQVQ